MHAIAPDRPHAAFAVLSAPNFSRHRQVATPLRTLAARLPMRSPSAPTLDRRTNPHSV